MITPELLTMTYPFADALQHRMLAYTVDDGTARVIDPATGNDRTLQVQEGLEFSCRMKTKASRIDPDLAWMLIQVRGKLHFLLVYSNKTKMLDLFVVDRAKITSHVNLRELSGDTPDRIVPLFASQGALVAHYFRDRNESTWSKSAGSLDFGHEKENPGDHRRTA